MKHWLDLDSPPWVHRAACSDVDDPAAFIADVVRSPLVCVSCPVIRECAAQADEQGETWGVWGGVDRGRLG